MKRTFDIESRLRELVTGERQPQFRMAIAIDGSWHYQGSAIERQELVKLFATALHRAPDGSYWLVTPFEAGLVEVADVPFTIVALEVDDPGPAQRIRLRSNLDAWVSVDDEHPLAMRPPPEGGGPIPYVTVGRHLEARLLRPVFYHLAELAETDATTGRCGVRSAGRFFALDEGAGA